MKFPYGIADFYKLITENYFYVDRTDRIRLVEEAGPHLLFLRPRRFGKSLWLSTLENYYDVAKADEFERLFGHLAIGQNPTPLHNRYFVMKWDFSAVASHTDVEQIERALHDHINGCVEQFKVQYRDHLDYEIQLHQDNALRTFQSVLAAVRTTPYRLYLLIDEYDNFANEVVMGGQPGGRQRYEELLYGEGAFKSLFKAIKATQTGMGLDRVFITGVSPIVMSDATSGYNVAKNIYFEPQFNDLCGFWAHEIEEVVAQIAAACGLPAEKTVEALAMMRTFYNGYAFSDGVDSLLYNPTLALYFFDHFQRRCGYPRNMLDNNLAMDRAKIAYVARLPGGEALITQALQEEPPLSLLHLEDRFGVAEMLAPSQDTRFMASLLTYLGVLTLAQEQTAAGKQILRIPNLVARRLYAEQLQEMLLPAGRDRDEAASLAEALYSRGDPQPLCNFVEQRYFPVFDNRDYLAANELTIKTALLTLLFNDILYIVDSETALARGYADLTLIVRPEMRRFQLLDLLIECKFVKLGEVGMSGEEVRSRGRAELLALEPVQQRLAEAGRQLHTYRQALHAQYGDLLRLRAYAMVALGFERLVWQEIESEHEG